jgi:hypothetical protein
VTPLEEDDDCQWEFNARCMPECKYLNFLDIELIALKDCKAGRHNTLIRVGNVYSWQKSYRIERKRAEGKTKKLSA